MELNDIQQTTIALMDALKAHGLAELSLDAKEFKLKLRAHPPMQAAAVAAPAATAAAVVQGETPAPAPAEEELPGTKVTAPLVGTFYAAPASEEPPYIEVGQQVKKGDTLFIIEAMKTMNEIAAPCDGKVSRILAQSGDMVEFGQLLVVIV